MPNFRSLGVEDLGPRPSPLPSRQESCIMSLVAALSKRCGNLGSGKSDPLHCRCCIGNGWHLFVRSKVCLSLFASLLVLLNVCCSVTVSLHHVCVSFFRTCGFLSHLPSSSWLSYPGSMLSSFLFENTSVLQDGGSHESGGTQYRPPNIIVLILVTPNTMSGTLGILQYLY